MMMNNCLGSPAMSMSTENKLQTKRNYNNTQRVGSFGQRNSNSIFLAVLLLVQCCAQVQGWGTSNSNNAFDYSIYGNSATRDWLYDGSTLSFQVLGCVWGVVEDSEEAGCLEDESEDGTYNWYMMANCRRPQVAYSVYSTSQGGSGCSTSSFVGSVSLLNCDMIGQNILDVFARCLRSVVPISIVTSRSEHLKTG